MHRVSDVEPVGFEAARVTVRPDTTRAGLADAMREQGVTTRWAFESSQMTTGQGAIRDAIAATEQQGALRLAQLREQQEQMRAAALSTVDAVAESNARAIEHRQNELREHHDRARHNAEGERRERDEAMQAFRRRFFLARSRRCRAHVRATIVRRPATVSGRPRQRAGTSRRLTRAGPGREPPSEPHQVARLGGRCGVGAAS